MGDKLIQLINLCLGKNIPFVSFRMPGQDKLKTWIQLSGGFNFVEHIQDLAGKKAFVYAPFHRRTNFPLAFFEPELIIDHNAVDEKLLKEIAAKTPLYPQYPLEKPIEVNKKDYLRQAEKFLHAFDPEFPKAVLSRVHLERKPKAFDPGAFFRTLQSTYPDAFCHIINIPGAGTWMGASPESLLRVDGGRAQTIALAGTQNIDNIQWTAKEIEEQKIVSSYIESILSASGIDDFKKEETSNHPAGRMVHLSTRFTFPQLKIKNKMVDFLAALHPTPAVCGLPKETALDLILNTEKHNREFYSGYCGVIDPTGKTDLFVNLRCMKILPEQLALYVGGGLTKDSIPEKEWEETELKLQTLRHILQKT